MARIKFYMLQKQCLMHLMRKFRVSSWHTIFKVPHYMQYNRRISCETKLVSPKKRLASMGDLGRLRLSLKIFLLPFVFEAYFFSREDSSSLLYNFFSASSNSHIKKYKIKLKKKIIFYHIREGRFK